MTPESLNHPLFHSNRDVSAGWINIYKDGYVGGLHNTRNQALWVSAAGSVAYRIRIIPKERKS